MIFGDFMYELTDDQLKEVDPLLGYILNSFFDPRTVRQEEFIERLGELMTQFTAEGTFQFVIHATRYFEIAPVNSLISFMCRPEGSMFSIHSDFKFKS